MKEKLMTLDEATKAFLARKADRIVAELEAQRELGSVCMVVDMVGGEHGEVLVDARGVNSLSRG